MPLNKIHDILDDAVSKPYVDKAHLTRIGLMLNTVDKSKPIPMTEDDRAKQMLDTKVPTTVPSKIKKLWRT
jgi:hypothetical protein